VLLDCDGVIPDMSSCGSSGTCTVVALMVRSKVTSVGRGTGSTDSEIAVGAATARG
jgi:hypothetical protein